MIFASIEDVDDVGGSGHHVQQILEQHRVVLVKVFVDLVYVSQHTLNHKLVQVHSTVLMS